jgi:hypothetical protein
MMRYASRWDGWELAAMLASEASAPFSRIMQTIRVAGASSRPERRVTAQISIAI